MITTALASKYTCWPGSGTSQTARLNANAAVVPRATSTSMFAAPPRSAFHDPE